MPLPDIRFSQRRQQAAEQSIAYLMQQGIENRDVISLAAGFVDEATLWGVAEPPSQPPCRSRSSESRSPAS